MRKNGVKYNTLPKICGIERSFGPCGPPPVGLDKTAVARYKNRFNNKLGRGRNMETLGFIDPVNGGMAPIVEQTRRPFVPWDKAQRCSPES